MYCLMKMETKRPGTGTESVLGHEKGTTFYEFKMIQGVDEQELLANYMAQAEEWLIQHPDRKELGIIAGWLQARMSLAHRVWESGGAAGWLADLLSCDIERRGKSGISCTVTAFGCYAGELWELSYELEKNGIKLPATPADFDWNAIESAEARDCLCGEQMDTASVWNRKGWKLCAGLEEAEGFLEEMNRELAQIAHDPYVKGQQLKYWQAIY